jgi:serine/threonine protein phosphatase PrpC
MKSQAIITDAFLGDRQDQEDDLSVFHGKEQLLLAVADGMGGHAHGRQASRWLIEELENGLAEHAEASSVFTSAVSNAIRRMQQTSTDMGCTFVAAIVERQRDQYRISFTWLGDSRIYLFNQQPQQPAADAILVGEAAGRSLWLLSRDDSFIWGFHERRELTLDQLSIHPNKNQLELSVQSQKPQAADIAGKRTQTVILKTGDMLFLCTDGIWETFMPQASLAKKLLAPDPKRVFRDHFEKTPRTGMVDNATYVLARADEHLIGK